MQQQNKMTDASFHDIIIVILHGRFFYVRIHHHHSWHLTGSVNQAMGGRPAESSGKHGFYSRHYGIPLCRKQRSRIFYALGKNLDFYYSYTANCCFSNWISFEIQKYGWNLDAYRGFQHHCRRDWKPDRPPVVRICG